MPHSATTSPDAISPRSSCWASDTSWSAAPMWPWPGASAALVRLSGTPSGGAVAEHRAEEVHPIAVVLADPVHGDEQRRLHLGLHCHRGGHVVQPVDARAAALGEQQGLGALDAQLAGERGGSVAVGVLRQV